jgi:hypothetical protein
MSLSGSASTILSMTLTSIITLNAVLGAAVAYALHHLLAYGLSSHRAELHELASVPEREVERLAA